MYKINLDELENAEEKTLFCDFEDNIKEIDSIGPIKADLTIKSLGEFIEVKGNVNGKVRLECDLCLKEFDYELNFEIDELYVKNSLMDEYSQETEIKDGQFVTDLNGANEIDIYDLLYQSVILNLPNKKVCGINCNGDKFLKEENLSDPRLEVFKNLKIEDNK